MHKLHEMWAELYCSKPFSWISQNYVKGPAAGTHAELVNMTVVQYQIDIHQLFDGDILGQGHSLLKKVEESKYQQWSTMDQKVQQNISLNRMFLFHTV